MREQVHTVLGDLSSTLSEASGLRVGDDKLPALAELLSARMQATGAQSAAAYLELVANDLGELAEAASAISVSETYFLRDSQQFAAFARLVEERAARGLKHIRVLSAGCATGEEAYSIAITIRETLPNAAAWHITIIGADLGARSLATARRARYTPWSLRQTPEPIRQKYFVTHGSNYVLAPEISEAVRFEQHNLTAPTTGLWRPEAYDVVFFRNVLMYLTAEAARGTVESVARSLTPGGYLFLGHAENLRGLSQSFQLLHSHETFYYQLRNARPAPDVSAPPDGRDLERRPVSTDWFSVIAGASARIGALSLDSAGQQARARMQQLDDRATAAASPPSESELVPRVMSLITLERFDDALVLLDAASGTDRTDVRLLRAVLRLNTGRLEEALAECALLLDLDDMNADAHFVLALCREQQGDVGGACDHSRTASYLDTSFAMPHLHLGRLARRSGQLPTARRELTLAVELLLHESPTRIVLFGGGFDGRALRDVGLGELAACRGQR